MKRRSADEPLNWVTSAKSMYIRLRLAFASSSSFNRLISEASIPPYFFFRLSYVAELIPWVRHSPSTFVPVSASFSIGTICVSVNRDFFIVVS